MTRRLLFAVAALCALLFGAGCSDRDAPMIPEMDEPFYVDGVQLNKQGRNGEALTSFLKVIEKRGDRGAPESHLEVGVIYLNHTKDPVLAYYHFKRYLDLQANSKEAPRVRGMVDAALRDIARRFPGRPADDQSVRLAAAEEITKLRRENDELRAELQTLRGGGAAMNGRAARNLITLPVDSRERSTPPPQVPVAEPGIMPAPAQSRSPMQANAAPAPGTQFLQSPQSRAANPRPTAPATMSGRTHTVQKSEGLFAIARRYDSKNPSQKMRAIIEANPDVLTNGVNTPLQPGMRLRIP